MEIFIHVVGKVKDNYLINGINDYVKKISKYCKVTFYEYPDAPIPKNASKLEEEKIKEIECLPILKKLKVSDYIIALDLNKKELNSEDFAVFLSKSIEKANAHLHFVIGGSLGLSDNMKKRVNDSISLSKLTFLHTMTRLLLLEQIYRAFKINNNETYHK